MRERESVKRPFKFLGLLSGKLNEPNVKNEREIAKIQLLIKSFLMV